jgi:cytochrome b6-f complex iron-sulfur subunit
LQVVGLGSASAAISACGDDNAPPGLDAPLLVGTVGEVEGLLDEAAGTLYVPEAKAYLVRVPADLRAALGAAHPELAAGIAAGYMALWQKCTHTGCRVPSCESSGRFECPCHGSKFSAVGELESGPAKRGLDLFAVEVNDSGVRIDTTIVIRGLDEPVVQINPTGPSCI